MRLVMLAKAQDATEGQWITIGHHHVQLSAQPSALKEGSEAERMHHTHMHRLIQAHTHEAFIEHIKELSLKKLRLLRENLAVHSNRSLGDNRRIAGFRTDIVERHMHMKRKKDV